ncbi:hypothetical protein JE952_000483 [Flavobacterium psychrophilum]|uniref:hypothetical protein n=1 Tax=Flavobacterium psychrophilum TaxID=96345 RepID=UPI000B7C1368|nr:hypothetical protein [Flavobacterium psychrophilum]EKT4548879.1 hypothetical protein [Flavobacterium psychrophilum]SNA79752.1 membrane hypothetical protein [Flavobacterium psychrophilum]SNB13197.1 membrane hypothetical protein [Flavobacterium psychrophilum]
MAQINSSEKIVNIVKENFIYLSIIPPLLSFVSTFFYYLFINIPIYNYLDIDEYLTQSFPIVLKLILFPIIGYIVFAEFRSRILSFEKFINKLKYVQIEIELLILCFFIILIYLITFPLKIYLNITPFIAIGSYLNYVNNNKNHNTNSKIAMMMMLLVFTSLFYDSLSKLDEKLWEGNNVKMELIFKDSSKINLGLNIIEIGETKKYFFIYNKIKKVTHVLKKEDIKEIKYAHHTYSDMK